MELIHSTVGAQLQKAMQKFGDAPMAVFPDTDVTMTWNDLDRASARFAAALLSHGYGKGSHVALLGVKCAEWLAAFFGIIRMGGVVVPFNPAFGAKELPRFLAKVDTELLVLVEGSGQVDLAPLAGALQEAMPALPLVYSGKGTPAGAEVWENYNAAAEAINPAQLSGAEPIAEPQDTFLIVLTTGTTAVPKAVQHNHIAALNHSVDYKAIQLQDFIHSDIVPWFHISGISNMMFCCLNGACFVCRERFNLMTAYTDFGTYGCTVCSLVPALCSAFLAVAANPQMPRIKLHSVVIGGDRIPAGLMEAFAQTFGLERTIINYGLAETCAIGTNLIIPGKQPIPDTIGFPNTGVACKTILPDGSECPVGKEGEMCIRGFNVMQGYYGDPEGTAATFTPDGFFRTGDLCVQNADGSYRFLGRLKDIIIRKGENIAPAEVEAVLLKHPAVKDAAVFGLPDADTGESVAAAVISALETPPSAEALQAFCKEQLARYKVPDRFFFVDAFPQNATGKVDKRALQKRFCA
ncbi:MAG: acyl--CoA ligase [Oscillospiraceae bacterium]|jgi:acyl-CoA synthetase (AMP-forming)/AMP-acid ligase II|nr:acyl--CoA ligase [Oscillospiraceae bacterium]